MQTSKTYTGNELSHEVAILQLARALNQLAFAIDRLADRQYARSEDAAAQEEHQQILQSLVRRDWNEVFVTQREAWCSQLRVVVCGHALLEKFLMPYKAMTAHAYVIHDIGPNLPEKIDEWSGRALLAGRLFSAPASLSPLPLAGIPGWWAAGRQDQVFYEDQDVFRPAPERLVPAPVHRPGDL